MVLFKYKTSRANTHSHHANWKATAVTTVNCPNCDAPALPHMAYPSCGNYRSRTYRSAIQPAHTRWILR